MRRPTRGCTGRRWLRRGRRRAANYQAAPCARVTSITFAKDVGVRANDVTTRLEDRLNASLDDGELGHELRQVAFDNLSSLTGWLFALPYPWCAIQAAFETVRSSINLNRRANGLMQMPNIAFNRTRRHVSRFTRATTAARRLT